MKAKKVTAISFAVVTTKFLFDVCNCMVDNDVGTGNFLLLQGFFYVCLGTHV